MHQTPHLPRRLLLASLLAALGAPALGQTTQTTQATQATQPADAITPDAPVQAVVVTGTYAKNRRSIESESPVDIIGARELTGTGSTELATVLGRLLPSLNFPRPSGADASDAVRPAQLRGLSPDQTLVLVNGKRRHTSSVVNVNGTQGRGSAPVDLNAIPLSAIDHIEVLRDGAAAQYGSDAIAGVINIILKRGAAGGNAEVAIGEYQQRDGKSRSVAGSIGFALGQDGWARVAIDAANRDATNHAGPDLRNPAEPRYGQVNQRFGDPETSPRSLFFNAQVRIDESTDWYAFGGYAQRDTSAAATWRTAYNGTALRSPTIFPQGFLPLENSVTFDRSFVTGLRGELAGWRWDASLNYGSNNFKLDLANTINQDLGAASPTNFYAGQLTNTQTVANLDIAREVPIDGLYRPLTVAIGAESRHERYAIGEGEPNSYYLGGSQGFSGFRPVNAGSHTRHNESLYLNLEAQLTEKLSAGLAARHERYSDFGSTTSVKGSTRLAINDAIALRATASSGFRAPSLAQQFYTITTTNFFVINGVNTPIETGTFPVNSAAAAVLGAVPLKPEKARNYSLGVQLQPTRNLSASLDVYRIDIDDRILFSSNLTLSDDLKKTLAAQGALVGAARYFTNAIDTRTTGVDLLTTYRVDLANKDRLDFTLGFNHNKNAVEHVADNPALLTRNSLLLIDRQTINRATVGSPKDKFSLAADYATGRWSGHGAVTRYGSFTVPQNNATLDQVYSPQWVLDVSASVKLDANWKLTAGVDNATNRYPDQVTSAGNLNNNGINPYSGFAPNGFNGRYYYAKANYNW